MKIQDYKNPAPADRFARDQSEFIRQTLTKAPALFHRHIESRFNYTIKKQGLSAANIELLKTGERLKRTPISLLFNDDEICNLAERNSREYSRCVAAAGVKAGRAYAQARGVKIPDCKEAGEVARLSDGLFWRRQLRKRHGRAVEGEALNLNIVNKKCEIYSSTASVKRRRTQKTRNRRILEEVVAVNELGEKYTLAELADLGVSNPAIRRGELMTRIAGFETYAQKHGHIGLFWTITAPSRMHSALSATGQRNPKYDGTTPRQAQQYLSNTWARVRAVFKRRGIDLYGMRVAEPQHDGTPHWHMLIFLDPARADEATAIYKQYALQVDGAEPGALKHRFTSKQIDWQQGTAAGYIAKYIAKNIDAYGVEYDLYGKDAEKSVERVDAWASTWSIRQFQQVGGPSVTVWRELRRMSSKAAEGSEVEQHFNAADLGDWFAYIEQMKKKPVTLLKDWCERLGRYLEPIGEQIVGVRAGEVGFITRQHQWTIESKKERPEFTAPDKTASSAHLLAGVTLGEKGQAPAGAFTAHVRSYHLSKYWHRLYSGLFWFPWSSVNNCTRLYINAALINWQNSNYYYKKKPGG